MPSSVASLTAVRRSHRPPGIHTRSQPRTSAVATSPKKCFNESRFAALAEKLSAERNTAHAACVVFTAATSSSSAARESGESRKSPVVVSLGHGFADSGGLRCVIGNGATNPSVCGGASSAHFANVAGFCGPANSADSSQYVMSLK